MLETVLVPGQTLFDSLKAYVGFTGESSEALRAVHPLVAPHVDAIIDDFYARNAAVRILFVSGYGDDLRGRLQGQLAESEPLDKPVDLERLLAWVTGAFGDGKAERPRR